MTKLSRIYVAGHRGLVGRAMVRCLEREGFANLLLLSRKELDLRDQAATLAFFEAERPEYVFLAAAKVGGILANSKRPAEFIADNLSIQSNVIGAAYRTRVQKLLFLGSSCIYPRDCPQPIREEYLLSGSLEGSNEGYAVAKIAGIRLCQAYNLQHGTRFITAMPTNLYGPFDNFDRETSHVLPALLAKFHCARESGGDVTVWGTGTARREFLHVDDLAEACLFLMRHYEDNLPINVGTGVDLTIRELAELIARVVKTEGLVVWDHERPDGTPRKWLDIGKITRLGWSAKIGLPEGISATYEWYRTHIEMMAKHE